MLTDSLTDDEILEEIRRFRNRHKESHILIYDSSQTELPEEMEYRILK